MRSDPKVTERPLIFQRLNYLWMAAHNVAVASPAAAQTYLIQFRKLADDNGICTSSIVLLFFDIYFGYKNVGFSP